jgi:DNA-binding LytR/AlgR family response regulator
MSGTPPGGYGDIQERKAAVGPPGCLAFDPRHAEESEKKPMPLSGYRILVVEDEWLIAADVVHALEEAGASIVGPYGSVVDSFEHLGDLDAIDGAVIDVGLGTETSFPLADAFRTTAMPFVFLTGVERSELPERFAHVPHMLKPFDADRIADMLVEAGVGSN